MTHGRTMSRSLRTTCGQFQTVSVINEATSQFVVKHRTGYGLVEDLGVLKEEYLLQVVVGSVRSWLPGDPNGQALLRHQDDQGGSTGFFRI
jgi:hypothetical protein